MLTKWRDEWIQFNTEQGRYVYPELVNAYHADLLVELAKRVEGMKKKQLSYENAVVATMEYDKELAKYNYNHACDDILQIIKGEE